MPPRRRARREVDRRYPGVPEPRRSPTRNVATLAECRTLEGIGRLVDTAPHLGHPVEAALQDPLDPALERGSGNSARTASSSQLDLDDASLDVRADQDEVAAVGLDRRSHQLQKGFEVPLSLGTLLFAQHLTLPRTSTRSVHPTSRTHSAVRRARPVHTGRDMGRTCQIAAIRWLHSCARVPCIGAQRAWHRHDATMKHPVSVIGIGMTPMSRRDLSPEELTSMAASAALSDAGLSASEVGLVLAANALGGSLNDQACIRGQAWLKPVGLNGVGVINVDNSCAGGASAFHLGVAAASSGESPVLVVGTEKMWTGSRESTIAGIEEGLPAEERVVLRERYCDSGSTLMGMNAVWVNHQLTARGTTVEQVAATVVKSRRFGSMNPLAQFRTPLTIEDVLSSPVVASPLRRLMCSSFTDGAAAVVLAAATAPTAPKVVASVVRSGTGDTEYHERLGNVAEEGWKAAGLGPEDVDVIELHDATSAEELYALEAMGFFAPGCAGVATVAGETGPGGRSVCVNPSGGLVSRGHPIGATGICQIVEIAQHLRGDAGNRQATGARLGVAVNTGGLINADPALVSVTVLGR